MFPIDSIKPLQLIKSTSKIFSFSGFNYLFSSNNIICLNSLLGNHKIILPHVHLKIDGKI